MQFTLFIFKRTVKFIREVFKNVIYTFYKRKIRRKIYLFNYLKKIILRASEFNTIIIMYNINDYFFFQFGVKVIKFDRKGYKRRTRLLILTNKSLCLNQILKNKLKLKEKIPLNYIDKLEVTSGKDEFLLVKISPQYYHSKV